MQSKAKADLVDAENPEWSAEAVNNATSFSGLPQRLQAKLKKRTRGAQLAPTKSRITIRLSQEVVDAFRASGDGWQTRMDSALQDWLKTHRL